MIIVLIPLSISFLVQSCCVERWWFVTVFLPNYGTTPFMKCYEPEAITRVKYIAITGAHEKTARYIYDCPI
uniref:Secreted protein n=1 Tax=Megaselia scalaris TaxID=36166 RepID=T1GB79_MEGSC